MDVEDLAAVAARERGIYALPVVESCAALSLIPGDAVAFSPTEGTEGLLLHSITHFMPGRVDRWALARDSEPLTPWWALEDGIRWAPTEHCPVELRPVELLVGVAESTPAFACYGPLGDRQWCLHVRIGHELADARAVGVLLCLRLRAGLAFDFGEEWTMGTGFEIIPMGEDAYRIPGA